MPDAATRAVLNKTENLLVAETSREALAGLNEDAAIELETRIRRARNKYVGQYRRGASARVADRGGRGAARPENTQALRRAEAFERALSRVSRRVGALAQESAAALRAERLAMAKGARQGDWPGADEMVPRPRRQGPDAPVKDLRTPASEKERAGTAAAGARRQAKRDSKRAAAR